MSNISMDQENGKLWGLDETDTRNGETSTFTEEEAVFKSLEHPFRVKFQERKYAFIRCVFDIDNVIESLTREKLLSVMDQNDMLERRMPHQKAEAVFNHIMNLPFTNVVLVAWVLKDETCNILAARLIDKVIEAVHKEQPFDRELIKKLIKLGKEGTLAVVEEVPVNGSARSGHGHVSLANASSAASRPSSDSETIEMISLRDRGSGSENDGGYEIGARGRDIFQADSLSIYDLEDALEKITDLHDLVDRCPEEGDTVLHASLYFFDDDDAAKAAEMILNRFQILVASSAASSPPSVLSEVLADGGQDNDETRIAIIEESNRGKMSLAQFLNCRGTGGSTALHIAVEYEFTMAVRLLSATYGCDLFIPDDKNQTALELMYLGMPEEITLILDLSISTYCEAGKNRVNVDFSGAIGRPTKVNDDKCMVKKSEARFEELAFLAHIVNTDKERQRAYLPHPLITLFLNTKWNKLKRWILASAVMQILIKLCYCALLINIFLVRCPHNESVLKGTETGGNHGETSFNGSEMDVEEFFLNKNKTFCFMKENNANCISCVTTMFWIYLAGVIASCSAILIMHELVEFWSKIKTAYARRRGSKLIAFFSGALRYFEQLENVLQLICYGAMIAISVSVLQGRITDTHYTIASISVLSVAILILLEIGSFPKYSVYIQMLIKVTKSFAKFLCLYSILIFAFSASFNITFPSEKPFSNGIDSIVRTLMMMAGELDFQDLFYKDDSKEEPEMKFTGFFVYACFTIIMTFILINLLVGLVVSDVEQLKDKAEVVALSVALERCYTMESTLQHRYWRWLHAPLNLFFGVIEMIGDGIGEVLKHVSGTEAQPDWTFCDYFWFDWNKFNLNFEQTTQPDVCWITRVDVKDLPKNIQQKIKQLNAKIIEHSEED